MADVLCPCVGLSAFIFKNELFEVGAHGVFTQEFVTVANAFESAFLALPSPVVVMLIRHAHRSPFHVYTVEGK